MPCGSSSFGAGIYALFNLVLAGTDLCRPVMIQKGLRCLVKIWQTILGLAFSAGAFGFSGHFRTADFWKMDFILNPSIPTL